MFPVSLFFGCLFLAMIVRMVIGRCCCNDSPCVNCDTNTTPSRVQLDFSGVVNNDCSDCGDYNTTSFIGVSAAGRRLGLGGVICIYPFNGSLPCDAEASRPMCSIEFEYLGSTGPMGRNIAMYHEHPYCNVIEGDGGKAETSTWDCSTTETGIAMANNGGPFNCDWSAATFDVTPFGPYG